MLVGSEVKSLRQAHVTLGDGHVIVKQGELFLSQVHIEEYAYANRQNHAPNRPRKLLLNRREIRKITVALEQRGSTCIALQIYFKGGRAKVELALARGKKLHDKRHALKARDAQRAIERSRDEH